MNNLSIFTLKALRKLYTKSFGGFKLPALQRETDPDKASEKIYSLLESGKPCMIARFGSTELLALVNYLGVNAKEHSVWRYIQGKQPEWWWQKATMQQMQQWSGFFPPTEEHVARFCKLMLEDMSQLDILGSWVKNEYYVRDRIEKVYKTNLLFLEPYWSSNPWSRVLKGKKILVVHPFVSTIRRQYAKREQLFEDKRLLPTFELYTLKAVQSIGGNSSGFKDWFEALHWMESEVDKIDYDVCLIGCGAYGFPLAAHVKRQGKQAIHLGGALQLLFGIKGKRWENPNYGAIRLGRQNAYNQLFNDNWVYPSTDEKPVSASLVENGCYW